MRTRATLRNFYRTCDFPRQPRKIMGAWQETPSLTSRTKKQREAFSRLPVLYRATLVAALSSPSLSGATLSGANPDPQVSVLSNLQKLNFMYISTTRPDSAPVAWPKVEFGAKNVPEVPPDGMAAPAGQVLTGLQV